jgi:hypothetical protein
MPPWDEAEGLALRRRHDFQMLLSEQLPSDNFLWQRIREGKVSFSL